MNLHLTPKQNKTILFLLKILNTVDVLKQNFAKKNSTCYLFAAALFALSIYFVPTKVYPQNTYADSKYHITIDLKNATADNKVKVTVYPPTIQEQFATYVIPTTAYGGYSKAPLKELTEGFTAYDAQNRPLTIDYISQSEIVIHYANRLHHLEYWVKDATAIKNKKFYQAASSKIQANENFIINHNGFYGYFYNYMKYPFEVNISKPRHLYGASALSPTHQNDTLDRFLTPNYFTLFENPVMYAKADTASFKVKDTRIHIAVYSETGNITAKKVYYTLKYLTKALEVFLEKIPVQSYHFILYFAQKEEKTTNLSQYGGLMCGGASSFYVLPEMKRERTLRKLLEKVAAHEFLHLLTPYQLYSENVAHAGFSNLPMSKHLWLYEGVTEYFSLLSRVKSQIEGKPMLNEEVFFREMAKKIALTEAYPSISLTEMSENILKKKNRSIHHNLYYKGAVVAFLLDIRLHELSEGKLSLRKVLLKLAKKYGHEQPFDDDRLIEEIVEMTYPEIATFFKKYVINKQALPYKKTFAAIGMKYYSKIKEEVGTFGKFTTVPNFKKGKYVFTRVKQNVLGIRNGDIIEKINQTTIKTGNFNDFSHYLRSPNIRKPLELEVIRKGKTVRLMRTPLVFTKEFKHVFRPIPNSKPKAHLLRKKLFKILP